MKTQPREVYGYGSKLRTSKRIPSAGWWIVIISAGILAGALW